MSNDDVQYLNVLSYGYGKAQALLVACALESGDTIPIVFCISVLMTYEISMMLPGYNINNHEKQWGKNLSFINYFNTLSMKQ